MLSHRALSFLCNSRSFKAFLAHRDLCLNISIPIVFFIITYLGMPLRNNFMFDTDEGQELTRAILYSQGFPLYDLIWSDQPPLLTVFLSSWFDFGGQSVLGARLLILCFSTLLIWAFFQTLKISLGRLPALIGTVFLGLSCNFLRLSVSVMGGIPSLCFAMLSVYTLMLFCKKSNLFFLVSSAIAIAISLQFKMFTIFLLPLQIFVLVCHSSNPTTATVNRRYNFLLVSGLWLVVFSTSFLTIGFIFNSLHLDSTFKFHLEGKLKHVFINENSIGDVIIMYVQDLDYVLLAILGSIAVLAKRDIAQTFPLLWLGTATLVLLNHKPIWYHHYLLLSLPIIWLASYGVAVALPYFKGFKVSQFNLAVGLCIFAAIAAPIKLGLIQWQNQLFLEDSRSRIEIVEQVLDYQKETHWVFTDNPMYAFSAHLQVPPEMAVLSRKRIASGEITRDDLYTWLAKYRPEQVILERFPEVYEPIRPYLEANYSKIGEHGPLKHYVLRRLVEQHQASPRSQPH